MVSSANSVLTVMAHPDDAELWAGGTLTIHAQVGALVTIVISRANEVRDREAAAGAKTLGTSLRLLDELTTDALRNLLTELRAEIVITHNPGDIHPDHQQAAQTLLAALPEVVITTGHPRRVYTCDGYHNLHRDGRPCACQYPNPSTSTSDLWLRIRRFESLRARHTRLTHTSVTGAHPRAGPAPTSTVDHATRRPRRTPGNPPDQWWSPIACASSPSNSDTASTTKPGNPNIATAALP